MDTVKHFFALAHQLLVILVMAVGQHILLVFPILPNLILISLTILHYYFYKHISSPNIVMRGNRQRNQEDENTIDEFLRLRPVRAIDRMLNENSVEKVYTLYNCLQEKIRRNTSDLRSTLTQKYQNLVDCSNLLNTIQHFTREIEVIEKDISHIFHQKPQTDETCDKKRAKDIVSIIEEKLFRKSYQSAMLLSYSLIQENELEERERLYLPYLRIQIIQSLENELITKKISPQSITQTIACLNVYVQSLSPGEREELVSNTNDLEEGTLLALVAQALKARQQADLLDEGDILEIVFKCKLFSLNRAEKGVPEDEKISKFFYDIYQLIGQREIGSSEINRLAEIFCKNLAQIEAHLSETFIISNSAQTISFRYDLYEKLLSSQNFIQILEKLHIVVTEHYKEAPAVSLRENFLNLWNNYYQQLLKLLFNKCDPTEKLPKLSEAREVNVPAELLKYFTTDGNSVEEQLKCYQEELTVFFSNLKELLKKTQKLSKTKISQKQIMSAIKEEYLQRIKEVNLKIEATCIQLAQDPTEHHLRHLISLFLLCDQFNLAMQQEASTQQHLLDLSGYPLRWKEDTIKEFSSVFSSKSKNDWSIRFDTFFMVYNPSSLSVSKLEIIKKVILAIIEGMLTASDSQRGGALISEWRGKKDREQKQVIDHRNRLPDLPPERLPVGAFAKKK